jgi:hypothetical protein
MSAAAAAAAASAASYVSYSNRHYDSTPPFRVEKKKTSKTLPVGLIIGSVISILAVVAGFIKFSK